MFLLSQFSFKGRQEQAASDPNPAIAVTAGAGSGKTLSLVGRYLHLLEEGYPLRSILAITFTEKAAREMRSKIRNALVRVFADATQFHPSSFILHPSSFILHPSSFDFARIGTIHGLCAEILRAHPAEAGLDPAFDVLEEGLAAALQAEAIDSALAWAAADEQSAALFEPFKENELREILKALLSRRLDVPSLYTDDTGLPFGYDVTDSHGKEKEKIRENLLHPRKERFSSALASHLTTYLDSPLLLGAPQGCFAKGQGPALSGAEGVRSWQDALADLASRHSSSPDDKLELARRAVLVRWDEIQSARAAQNWDAVLSALAALRKSIDTRGGKKNAWDESDLNAVREEMAALKDIYDEHLKFLAEKARFALDEQVAAHLPALHRLFDQTLREYGHRKDERGGLDFDDLEGLTARLLAGHPEVRAQLQSELRAVLVDEFQDTNDRQRQIVYALTGFNPKASRLKPPSQKIETLRVDAPVSASADFHELRQGFIPTVTESNTPQSKVDLFVVGDSKQSIYKFRSADVTVFRRVQSEIQSSGGLSLDLDLTFRAHKPLLETLNSLLAPILGESDDPARPYAVPFAPLRAYRQAPVRENIRPPYVEFHLGLGENAEEGRTAAATALSRRLRRLYETEGFGWGEMALLFRSSTAFAAYETALEGAAIPFVTVAGRGFYDRPEIRDLLNALAAIADPSDDLALAGLLRSPAFALSDADIYRLRFPNQSTSPAKLIDSLRASPIHPSDSPLHPSSFIPSASASTSSARRLRASLHPFTILTELHDLSSRAPAAAVLKRLLDLTGYRATLRVASLPGGARMIRNVEKLLADAHRSRLVSLTDFLAYVQTLRDVGLREGEAPADPSSSADDATRSGGAVQLMTVHKAKGLEFPLTVIADAAYEHRGGAGKTLLHPELGLLLDLKDGDFHPAAWQLSSRLADELDDAEDRRLLYVAATRAKEKLLISGHVKPKKDGSLTLNGWLERFGAVVGLDEIKMDGEMSTPRAFPAKLGGISLTLYPVSSATASDAPELAPVSTDSPLPAEAPQGYFAKGLGVKVDLLEPLAPSIPAADEKTRAREADPPQRIWRVVSTARRPRAPAWVVGKLVHECLHRWRFPAEVQRGFPDDGFDAFLRPFAIESGLTDPAEIHAAVQESRLLLERLRAHPLFAELDTAERHHEVRYDLPEGRGVIDLLYRTPEGWFIIDFKTDEVRSDEEARSIISRERYDLQVARYAEAIATQLGFQAKTRLIFLNVNGAIWTQTSPDV